MARADFYRSTSINTIDPKLRGDEKNITSFYSEAKGAFFALSFLCIVIFFFCNPMCEPNINAETPFCEAFLPLNSNR